MNVYGLIGAAIAIAALAGLLSMLTGIPYLFSFAIVALIVLFFIGLTYLF